MSGRGSMGPGGGQTPARRPTMAERRDRFGRRGWAGLLLLRRCRSAPLLGTPASCDSTLGAAIRFDVPWGSVVEGEPGLVCGCARGWTEDLTEGHTIEAPLGIW
jgi:hypothetical protein